MGTFKDSVYHILTDPLGYRKVCSHFVPRRLTDDQKESNIVKTLLKSRKRTKFPLQHCYWWRNLMFPIKPQYKRWRAEDKPKNGPAAKNYRFEKSKQKMMLICFYDSKRIVHFEFRKVGQTVTVPYYLGVLRRLLHFIGPFRPEYLEEWSYCLLHDNGPSRSPSHITGFWSNDAFYRSITLCFRLICHCLTFIHLKKLHLSMYVMQYA